MQTAFTPHCIAWQAGATLFQDVRVAACAGGLLSPEALADYAHQARWRPVIVLGSGREPHPSRLTA